MKLTEQDVVKAVKEVTLRRLRVWVKKGWITPATGAKGPSFDDVDLARIRLVCEFRNELNLNEDAVAVVLSLMDQIYGLRCELRTLAAAVERQPNKVRREIVDVVQDLTKN